MFIDRQANHLKFKLLSNRLHTGIGERLGKDDPIHGQSKTACALLAVEATRLWADDGILANSLNPGAIATNLQKHTGGLKTPPERRKTLHDKTF